MNIIRKFLDKFSAGLHLAAEDIKHIALISAFCMGVYITYVLILSVFIPTVALTVSNVLYVAYTLLLTSFSLYAISVIIYAIVCEIEYDETKE